MPDTDCFFRYLFLIEDFSRIHLATDSETLPDHSLEQIDLNFTHQARFDLSERFVPMQMQRRFFLFQFLQLREIQIDVAFGRKLDAIGQRRL